MKLFFFSTKKQAITWSNELEFIIDYGESEAITLYKEIQANFLLIDDRKARAITENLNVNCIGTLGLLISAKQKHLISELKPSFVKLLQNQRHYSLSLLNELLVENNEQIM